MHGWGESSDSTWGPAVSGGEADVGSAAAWRAACLGLVAGPDDVEIDPARTAAVVVDIANDVAHPDGALTANPDLDTTTYRDSIGPLLRLIDALTDRAVPWVAVESAYDAAYVSGPMRARLAAMGILGQASPKGAWGSTVIDELIDRRPTYRVLKSHFSPFSRRAVCWQPGASADLDHYLGRPAAEDEVRMAAGLVTLPDLFDEAAARQLDGGDPRAALDDGRVCTLAHLLDGLGVDTLIVAGGATHVCQDATVVAASERGFRTIEPVDACGSEDPLKHWMYLHNHGLFRSTLCTVDTLVAALGR